MSICKKYSIHIKICSADIFGPLVYPFFPFPEPSLEQPTVLRLSLNSFPWRRERLPTPVFWPDKFHGLYSPWDCRELDMIEWLSALALHSFIPKFSVIDYSKSPFSTHFMPNIALLVGDRPWFLYLSVFQSPDHLSFLFFVFFLKKYCCLWPTLRGMEFSWSGVCPGLWVFKDIYIPW